MRKTVLLVDDDEDILALIGSFLRQDYNIIEASYISDAMFILQKEHVDLVITDYFMSPRNGVHLIRELRKSNQQIPVIMISGYSLEDVSSEVEGLDICAIVNKPLSKEQILDLVEQHI